MNKRAKVSIIVPVYNTDEYLEKCLNSLINQTLKEIEIIIINDGSTDTSEKIINKYTKNYSNIIKYKKITNGGVSNARNIGLNMATGEYVGFCDSDDYIELNTYKLLYEKAINNKSDIVLSGYYKEDEKGNSSKKGLDNMDEFSKSIKENPNILLVSNPFVTNKIFSKKLLDDCQIKFDKQFHIFEDLLFCYSVFLNANKIDKVNEALYHYVRRKDSSVTGDFNDNFYDLFPVMEKLKSFYHKNSNINFDDYLTYIAINHAYLRFIVPVNLNKIFLKYKFIKKTYSFLDNYDSNWKNNIYFSIKKRNRKKHKTIVYWILYPLLRKCRGL